MQKNHFKHFNARFLMICCVILCVAIIIHSCKKDSSVSADAAINDAKSWYESTYPSNNLSKNFSVLNKNGNTNNTDFTQHIKPDWNHGSFYNRLSKNTIELPVDPSGNISGELKSSSSGIVQYKKSNSKTSFLLLNDGQNYKAYIMTIIADSAYLNSDYSKLAKNTYRHIEKDFSGVLSYFTPKGLFVSAWFYKNGIIARKLMGVANAINNSSVLKIRSRDLSLSVASDIEKPKTLTQVCTHYYADFYQGDEFLWTVDMGIDCLDDGNDDMSFQQQPDQGAPDPGGINYLPPVVLQDTTKDPCAEKLSISVMAANATIASENAAIYAALTNTSITSEYGVNQILSSLSSSGTYIPATP
jgi:hypothetical protein